MAAAWSVRILSPMTARARPARASRAGADPQVVGALLMLGGSAWLLRQTGLIEVPLQTGLSALLLVLGIGMVVTARRAGGAPLVAIGVLLTAALAVTSSVDLGALERGIGGESYRPTSATEIAPEYGTGFGDLHVDLRGVRDLATEQRSRMNVGTGSIEVLVPEGMPVDIRAEVGAGEISIFELPPTTGDDPAVSYQDPGFEEAAGRLVLELEVGLGSVSVVRESG